MRHAVIILASAAAILVSTAGAAQPEPKPGVRDDPDRLSAFIEDCVRTATDHWFTRRLEPCLEGALSASDVRGLSPEAVAAASQAFLKAIGPETSRWDVQGEAIRWLGLLGSHEALPTLDGIAESHGLREMRALAAHNAAAIRGPHGRTFDWRGWPRESVNLCLFGGLCAGSGMRLARVYDWPDTAISCHTHVWLWRDRLFRGGPTTRSPHPWAPLLWMRKSDQLPQGYFTATDNGQWGGELMWLPILSDPVRVIARQSFTSLVEDGPDVLAVSGTNAMLTLYGRVYRLRRGPETEDVQDRGWTVEVAVELPQHTRGVRILGDGLYAAYSPASAIVFTDEAILGEAECLDLPSPEASP